MQSFITVLALATAVTANNYTLYCGDSCTTGTPVNMGADYTGASCTTLDTANIWCYLVADETFYKAIVSKGDACEGSNGQEEVIRPGECFQGPWSSYQVSVSL